MFTTLTERNALAVCGYALRPGTIEEGYGRPALPASESAW
jgi:hypothetical protein